VLACVVAFVALTVAAARYQPVSAAGTSRGGFPGLPAGSGLRLVNDFGPTTGEIYVPPGAGKFTISRTIENSGPMTVTIEGVTLSPPSPFGPFPTWPLVQTGPALYVRERSPGARTTWKSGRPLHDVALGAGQAITIGVPVEAAYPCYLTDSSTGLDGFYLEERFSGFVHWLAVPLVSPVIMQEPFQRGKTGGLQCPQ
jgi:hypothetical protein